MTTDLVQGFLDDIVAHPGDPYLWLILADWLEDQGDPRAELVRLTWALQYEADHPDFPVRQARVQALLAGGMIPIRPRRVLGPGMEFAWIAPGSFWMGSPEDEEDRSDDEQRHRVMLTRPFWMSVYPVTQGQWQAVLGSNPSYYSRQGMGKSVVKKVRKADLERFPVEQVSWANAQAFCVRLGEQIGAGVALSTEAEWEYACRAGTTTPFHFGSVLNGVQANHNGNYPYGTSEKGPYLARTSPVGRYPSNAWGLYDMHGNVWEWCQDGYRADYEEVPATDQLFDQTTEEGRVLRGGSWSDRGWNCRAALRGWNAPGYRDDDVSVRVCLRLDR